MDNLNNYLLDRSKDINNLKTSDFTNKLIEELKEENATLKLTETID